MSTLVQTDTEAVVLLIGKFNSAWNNKDLGQLSRFLAVDVKYQNPNIKLGVFNFPGKEIHGQFKVLQFWRGFFEKFKSIEEDKKVLSIKKQDNGYHVICDAHNHGLRLSSKLIIILNSELQIREFNFTKVTKYKAEETISVFTLLIKQLKAKYFSN